MPQEFNVLQCYKCNTFQVHQVKKTSKWSCKLCGEKQSLKKVHGRGSGADCRQHVQKLNLLRGTHNQHQDEDAEFQLSLRSSHQEPNYINSEQYDPNTYETSNSGTSVLGNSVTECGSKWERYVDTDSQDCDQTWDGDDMDELNGVVVTMGRNKDINSGQGRGKKRKRDHFGNQETMFRSTMPPPNNNSNNIPVNNRQNIKSTTSCKQFQGTMISSKENKFNLEKDPINQNYQHHNNVTLTHLGNMKLKSKWNLFGSSENVCTEPCVTENQTVTLQQVQNHSQTPVASLYINSYSNCNNKPTLNDFESKVKGKTQIQLLSTEDGSFTNKVTKDTDLSLDALDDTNVSRKPTSAGSSHTSNKWGKYVIEDTTEEADEPDDEDEDEGELFVSAEDLKAFMK